MTYLESYAVATKYEYSGTGPRRGTIPGSSARFSENCLHISFLTCESANGIVEKNGKGFSRSNLVYTRKFYPAFPICETASHKLTWNRVRPSRQLPDGFSCKIKMKVFVNQWLSQWRPDG